MAHTSEIEKLERRYAENPQGRNFAPLADAYRKAGQVDQAIELCKSGLEHHPDYVSAHIVLGRCFIDKRTDQEAELQFRKVLELDPENVIAFKVLAEIGERGGRFDDSVAWLTKLLAADPMNGDAADALTAARTKAAQAAQAAKAAEPVVAPAPEAPAPTPAPEPVVTALPEAVTAAMEKPDFVVEHASAPPPASGLEAFDGHVDFKAVSPGAVKTEGLEVQEEVTPPPSPHAVEGLARTQYEGSGMFAAEAGHDDLGTVDLPLIMPDDLTPPRNRRTSELPSPTPPGAGSADAPPARTSAPVAAAVALSDDDGAADTAALSRAEPVLTETMAELYVKQGHLEDARRVYEALVEQRPADGRLRARVQALFGGDAKPMAGGETVRTFLKGILARRPGEPAPAPAPPAAPPARAGSPLDSAFARTSSDGEIPGAPTHEAGDSISLDEVFGEESRRGPAKGAAAAGSAPETAVAGGAEAGGGTPQRTAGFSFDEFFGAKGAPGTSPAPKDATAPARPSGARAKPQAEEEGDLDQFQAWLKGLKS